MKKILFICHGNICRSIMAEFIFKDMVRKAGREDEFEAASRATSRDDSDIDLIVEFREPVSILSLAMLRDALMEAWGLDVDIVHGPIRDTDILEVGKTVELYAA